MKIPGGGTFKRIFGSEMLKTLKQSLDIWKYFTPKEKTLTQYNYDQLKKAYRDKQGIRPVINLSASFLFANWFEIMCEDDGAQEFLTEFWNDNRQGLLQGGIEGGLFGNTYLAFEHDDALDEIIMKILHPGAVKPIFDKEKPWLITGYAIKTKIENLTIEETIDIEKFTIKINGLETLTGKNPYGILPIVHVAEICFSDETFGTGEIDEALFAMAEKYKSVLDNAVTVEEYHGSPIPIFKGVKEFGELKQKIEGEETWKPGMGLFLPSKDADAKFLESMRGVDNSVELLKKIFYNYVIQSETPEFMLGVHIPASQASTKEQRAPVERKTERRRLVWTKALQRANQILLRMREYHDSKKVSTYKTMISWGQIFEKDKTEEADVIAKKSQAVAILHELEIMSTESARRALPEMIDDPDKEKKRVEDERQQQEKTKTKPEPLPQEATEEEKEE